MLQGVDVVVVVDGLGRMGREGVWIGQGDVADADADADADALLMAILEEGPC